MIDLFSVKLNGEYDDIGATPTIQNGLFLCDTNGETYTKGYSYQITNGNAERIDSAKDHKIKQAIYPTIQSVCEWLNNWFIKPKRCCNNWFETTDNGIKTGDLLYVKQYYPYVGYATVTDGNITLDNENWNPDKDYTYHIMHVPQDVEAAISKMIYYDIYNRETADGLKSENIGNYSYSKEETADGSLAYPAELVSGLETNYKKIRFVQ